MRGSWSIPDALVDAGEAIQALADSHAAAVIWGEYDAGRVRASITLTNDQQADWIDPLDSIADLPFTINDKVPMPRTCWHCSPWAESIARKATRRRRWRPSKRRSP